MMERLGHNTKSWQVGLINYGISPGKQTLILGNITQIIPCELPNRMVFVQEVQMKIDDESNAEPESEYRLWQILSEIKKKHKPVTGPSVWARVTSSNLNVSNIYT